MRNTQLYPYKRHNSRPRERSARYYHNQVINPILNSIRNKNGIEAVRVEHLISLPKKDLYRLIKAGKKAARKYEREDQSQRRTSIWCANNAWLNGLLALCELQGGIEKTSDEDLLKDLADAASALSELTDPSQKDSEKLSKYKGTFHWALERCVNAYARLLSLAHNSLLRKPLSKSRLRQNIEISDKLLKSYQKINPPPSKETFALAYHHVANAYGAYGAYATKKLTPSAESEFNKFNEFQALTKDECIYLSEICQNGSELYRGDPNTHVWFLHKLIKVSLVLFNGTTLAPEKLKKCLAAAINACHLASKIYSQRKQSESESWTLYKLKQFYHQYSNEQLSKELSKENILQFLRAMQRLFNLHRTQGDLDKACTVFENTLKIFRKEVLQAFDQSKEDVVQRLIKLATDLKSNSLTSQEITHTIFALNYCIECYVSLISIRRNCDINKSFDHFDQLKENELTQLIELCSEFIRHKENKSTVSWALKIKLESYSALLKNEKHLKSIETLSHYFQTVDDYLLIYYGEGNARISSFNIENFQMACKALYHIKKVQDHELYKENIMQCIQLLDKYEKLRIDSYLYVIFYSRLYGLALIKNELGKETEDLATKELHYAESLGEGNTFQKITAYRHLARMKFYSFMKKGKIETESAIQSLNLLFSALKLFESNKIIKENSTSPKENPLSEKAVNCLLRCLIDLYKYTLYLNLDTNIDDTVARLINSGYPVNRSLAWPVVELRRGNNTHLTKYQGSPKINLREPVSVDKAPFEPLLTKINDFLKFINLVTEGRDSAEEKKRKRHIHHSYFGAPPHKQHKKRRTDEDKPNYEQASTPSRGKTSAT